MSDFGFDPGETSASRDVKVLRSECHRLFDKLWTTQEQRDECYSWLADALDIPKQDCHFGDMGLQTLHRARNVLEQIHEIIEQERRQEIERKFARERERRLRDLERFRDGI